jgi:hypothetical protein
MFTAYILYCLYSSSVCDKTHFDDIHIIKEHIANEIDCFKTAMEEAPKLITQQRKEYSYFKYGCFKEKH